MRDVPSVSPKFANSTYARDWKSLPDQIVRELLSNAKSWHLKERQELFRCGARATAAFG